MDGRAHIGAELRRLRKRWGTTLSDFAELATYSDSLVNKVELGRRLIPEDLAVTADEHFGLPGIFAELARAVREETPPFEDFVACESRATRIRIYDPRMITGLLQTPEYARATMTAADPTMDIDAGLATRLNRQETLHEDDPPSVRVVLDESVLYRKVGDASVMRAQLTALLELPPCVSLQILPLDAGVHGALDGPLTILDPPDEPPVVQAEGWGHAVALDGPGRVDSAQDAYDSLVAVASSPEVSRELIQKVLEERWRP